MSRDGKRLALIEDVRTLRIYNFLDGSEILTFPKNNHDLKSVMFSPDGTQLVTGMTNGIFKLWDSFSGEEIRMMIGHVANVSDVAFSPDGRRLASAGMDQTVRIWDTNTGQESLALKGHTGKVVRVMFSPDGKRLVSASSDRTMKIWDARPTTTKLRTESYARGLLTTLRERVESLEVLRQRITTEKTLSDSVRKQALEWAEQFWENRVTRIRRKPKSGK